jgi:hypothetical protein
MPSHPRRAPVLALFVSCLAAAAPRAQDRRLADFVPDPASVTRWAQGASYPQAGFRVLHIEGEPRARGEQHGRLLAREISDYIATLAGSCSTTAPLDGWGNWRTMAQAWFLPALDAEWCDEMRGIAEGAAAAGARVGDRAIDFVDIVTVNAAIELDFLDSALAATPQVGDDERARRDHCSAFVATGKATADGHVVAGHITMWSTAPASRFRIWLDVQPARGHRVQMQTFPGGIWSGMDWYQNDAGLLLTETTIGQTPFERTGTPLLQRARQAMQYCDSIDGAVRVLGERNNGLYSNEWLLADAKTDEIAMFELGTAQQRLWRSSKNEWFGDTEGFYWGCNNAKELGLRRETKADLRATTTDLTWRASDRDCVWQRLFAEHRGRIDAEFAFRAFTTPPLCASHSLDVKFTTAAMLKNQRAWATFGPPVGPAWLPTPDELRRNPHTKALVGNDWSVFGAVTLAAAQGPADASWTLSPRAAETPAPAWNGTVLAATPADAWLPPAIDNVRDVLAAADRDVALFGAAARAGAAERRLGAKQALASLQPTVRDGAWYDVAAGKGALLLFALHEQIGARRFDALMQAFLGEHAGREVTVAQFVAAAEHVADCKLDTAFAPLQQKDWPASYPCWSIQSFEDEPEHALIVYGTQREARANREAAELLQRNVAARWHNFAIPLRSDSEVGAKELTAHHIVLVGRPVTNVIAARFAAALLLPARFGDASFTLAGNTCGRDDAAIVVAGVNPMEPRWSVVLFAGMSADATWRLVQMPKSTFATTCEALVIEPGAPPRPWARSR